MMAFGKLLQQVVFGNDKRRYEFTLVGNHYYLVDVTVHHQFRLYHLRGNVLPVRGLEQVFNPVGEEQLTVLEITGIAGMEPSVLVDGRTGRLILPVISFGYGCSAQQYLIVVTELQLQSSDNTPHGPYRLGLPLPVARDSGRGLRQPVTGHHVDAGRMDEFFHNRWNGSPGSREKVGVLKTQGPF